MSRSSLNATESQPQTRFQGDSSEHCPTKFPGFPLPDSSSAPPSLVVLAARLQEVATALRAFSQAAPLAQCADLCDSPGANNASLPDAPDDSFHGVSDDVPSGAAGEGMNDSPADASGALHEEASDEVRCYAVPAFIVREERQVLRMHKAENLHVLLNKVYDDLYTTAMLMRHFDESQQVHGFSIQMMGEHLLSSLKVLNTLCSLLADFDLLPEPTAD